MWTWAKGQNLTEDVGTAGKPGEMLVRRLTSILFKRFFKIAKGDYELRRVSPFSPLMIYSAATVILFIQFDFSVFFENFSGKSIFIKSDKNYGYFT